MSKKVNIFIVLLLCWLNLSFAIASSDNRRDGNWWRQQPNNSKLEYVIGFFDGIYLGYHFSYWNFANDQDKSECLDNVAKSFNEYKNKYFTNVRNDQIVDGLNEFYKDFKNRRILVYDAVWLIVNGIAGISDIELKEMIENWRKKVK